MDDLTPQPDGIPPGPVPTAFNVGNVPTDQGGEMVALQMQTPVGVSVYFMEPGIAVQVGNALRGAGKAGVSRLAVPPPSRLVVPGR